MHPDYKHGLMIILIGGPIAWVVGGSVGYATRPQPPPVVSSPVSTSVVTSVPEPLIVVGSYAVTVTADPETVTVSPEPVPPDKGGPLPSEMTSDSPSITSSVTLTPTAVPSSSDAGTTEPMSSDESVQQTQKDRTTSAATESTAIQLGDDSGSTDPGTSAPNSSDAVRSSTPSPDARCPPGKRSDGWECDPDSGSDHPSSSGR